MVLWRRKSTCAFQKVRANILESSFSFVVHYTDSNKHHVYGTNYSTRNCKKSVIFAFTRISASISTETATRFAFWPFMLMTWVFWAIISKSCNHTKVYSTNVSKSKTSATLSRYLGLPLNTITKLAHSTCTKLGTLK